GEASRILKLSLLHQEWLYDANYEAIRVSRGLGKQFYIGAGFTFLYLPFTYYDITGEQVGDSSLISQSLVVLNMGYSFRGGSLSIGANLKMYYSSIPDDLLEARYGSDYTSQKYLAFASDVGIFTRTNWLKNYIGPEPSFMFGLALKNVGYSDTYDKLPTEVQAGVSYRLLWSLLLAGQVSVPLYEPVYGAVGAEFDIRKKIFLQAGVRISQNPMLSVGFGYKLRDVELNASYTPRIAFPNIFSVSVNFFFGETKQRRREEQITSLLIEALELFQEGDFENALASTDKVLELDPKNKMALSLKKSIEESMRLEGEGKE
ncbi:MAG: UPF0164 family protein, partial [Spirochaetes bacterium]|nr:UPF0164 family protein [Spirochaetota bacterium]